MSFWQLAKSAGDKQSAGTGLSLHACLYATRVHGWQLSARSPLLVVSSLRDSRAERTTAPAAARQPITDKTRLIVNLQ